MVNTNNNKNDFDDDSDNDGPARSCRALLFLRPLLILQVDGESDREEVDELGQAQE